MYWTYQWLPVLLFVVQTAFCFHSQLPRSKGGRVKRFSSVLNLILENTHKRELHENVQRRKSQEILDQLKLLIASLAKKKATLPNALSLPFEVPEEGKADIEDDPFNEDGILYLTRPKNNDERLLNSALNKAVVLKYGPLRHKKDVLTKEEEEKLREILLGDDKTHVNPLRSVDEGGLPQSSGPVYRFDDLVA